MIRTIRNEWLWPSLLITLSIVPVLAGTIRIGELNGNADITSDNARFFLAPIPVVLHIITATIYCILGAFQFVPSIRLRKLNSHKLSGLLLVPCGLVSAATGLWMTQFYSGAEFNSLALYWLRIVVGATMIAAILLSVKALRRRNYRQHGVWMIRAYALGLGAGTQVLTGFPLLIFQLGSVVSVFISMAAGWAINYAVAEWIIRKRELSKISSKTQALVVT